MWDLSSLTRDRTQIPLQWDYAVLTTGAPGKAGGPINKKKKNKKTTKQKKGTFRESPRRNLQRRPKNNGGLGEAGIGRSKTGKALEIRQPNNTDSREKTKGRKSLTSNSRKLPRNEGLKSVLKRFTDPQTLAGARWCESWSRERQLHTQVRPQDSPGLLHCSTGCLMER